MKIKSLIKEVERLITRRELLFKGFPIRTTNDQCEELRGIVEKLQGIKQTVEAVDEDMKYLFKSTIWAKKKILWQKLKELLSLSK